MRVFQKHTKAITLGFALFLSGFFDHFSHAQNIQKSNLSAQQQQQQLQQQQQQQQVALITHLLNRIGYGPRPGDIQQVQKLGISNYIQVQLYPERIDDSAVDLAIAKLRTLQMSSADLMLSFFEDNQRGQKKLAGKSGSNDPLSELGERYSFRAVGELQTAKVLRAVESKKQLEEVLVDFWSNHFNIDVHKGPCRVLKVADDREVIRPYILGRFRDLLGASAHSPAMLKYLDNSDNTAPTIASSGKGLPFNQLERITGTIAMEPENVKPKTVGGFNENYAREIMELHTLGVNGGYTQKDVQEVGRCFTGWGFNPITGQFVFNNKKHDYGAKVVLGQDIPAGEGSEDGEHVLDILASQPATAQFISLELCRRFVGDNPPPTLVSRVAGVFSSTGGDLRLVMSAILYSPEFYYQSVRRTKIKSPFEYAVSAVRALDGHMNEDAWFDGGARYAADGVYTLGFGTQRIDKLPRQSLAWKIGEMGQPLFACQPPTGYSEDSRRWVSVGALIARINFALALMGGSVGDVKLSSTAVSPGQNADLDQPITLLNQYITRLLPSGISSSTYQVLQKNMGINNSGVDNTNSKPIETTTPIAKQSNHTLNPNQIMALILGSPEFQRH